MNPQAGIYQLPGELIAEIILHALDYYGPRRRRPEPVTVDTRTGPWVYSQVCQLWRQETLRISSIWSNIRLYCAVDRYPVAIDILSSLLSRSPASDPLDIDIYLCPSEYTEQILSLLLAQSSRWRNIVFIMNPDLTAQFAMMVMDHDLPSLRSIEQKSVDVPMVDVDDIGGKDFLSDAANLRRASVTDLMFTDYKSPVRPPWSLLTHFRASTASVEIDILSKMPNLVYFECSALDDLDPSGPQVTPVNLSWVGFHSLGHGFMEDDIFRLQLPASLNTVNIVLPFGGDLGRADDPRTFFRRSGSPDIRMLILRDDSYLNRWVPWSEYNGFVENWLTELTTVTTLEACGTDLESLFKLLREHDPPLLPNLDTLRLGSNTPMLGDSYICDFVTANTCPHIIHFLKARIPYGFKELCFSGSFLGHTEEELFELEMRYREELGEYADTDGFSIRFEETDIWGEPLTLL